MTWEGNVWAGPPPTSYGNAKKSPGDWPDPLPIGRDATPPTFPLHTLPPWIADFVEAEAASVQTPLDMPATFALGALAAVTGGRFRVRAWAGFEEATNAYVVCALPPASIKTPVHRHVTAPIVAIEEELQAGAAPARAQLETRRAIAEKRLKRAEDAAAKGAGDEGIAEAEAARAELDAIMVPPLPRLLVDDSTPEQLKTLLAEHGGRLAMLSAESALFGNVASQRYSRTPNLEAVLAGHSGDRIIVDRRGRREVIPDPRLTICIAVQPSVLREAFANDAARERGLFARFLYSVPPSNVGERDFSGLPPEVPYQVRAAWDRGLSRIAHAMLALDEPLVLPLADDARALFQQWRAFIEPERRTTGALASIAAWAGKMDGHALRLAGLLHVADEAAGPEVTAAAMGGAIALMEYFLAHAQIAFDVMGEDDASADARRVLAWAKSRGQPSFTRNEVGAGFKGRLTADELSPVLENLERLGYLRSRSQRGKGRTTTVYDVHPQALIGVTGVDP